MNNNLLIKMPSAYERFIQQRESDDINFRNGVNVPYNYDNNNNNNYRYSSTGLLWNPGNFNEIYNTPEQIQRQQQLFNRWMNNRTSFSSSEASIHNRGNNNMYPNDNRPVILQNTNDPNIWNIWTNNNDEWGKNLTSSFIEKFENVIKESDTECNICMADDKRNFKKLNCCKNEICTTCVSNWFGTKTSCPFCRRNVSYLVPC